MVCSYHTVLLLLIIITMAWKCLYMFRRDELKIIFDLGLIEFVDAEPVDGSPNSKGWLYLRA